MLRFIILLVFSTFINYCAKCHCVKCCGAKYFNSMSYRMFNVSEFSNVPTPSWTWESLNRDCWLLSSWYIWHNWGVVPFRATFSRLFYQQATVNRFNKSCRWLDLNSWQTVVFYVVYIIYLSQKSRQYGRPFKWKGKINKRDRGDRTMKNWFFD